MAIPRPLAHVFVISLSVSFGLWQLIPAGAPASFIMGLRSLVLVPFGVLCPVLSAGCLLHDLVNRRNPGIARFIHGGGVAFLLTVAFVLLWLRHW